MSGERPAGYRGNWLPLDPAAEFFMVRQRSYDWGGERDARLAIERLDTPPIKPLMSAADIAERTEALMGGFASSRILEVHGERMIKRTFNPGFRIGLHQKDLDLALSNARLLGVALPGTAMAQQLFNVCVSQDGAGWDHSAMVRALETMANFTVSS